LRSTYMTWWRPSGARVSAVTSSRTESGLLRDWEKPAVRCNADNLASRRTRRRDAAVRAPVSGGGPVTAAIVRDARPCPRTCTRNAR
jgi:hypothetical protein